MCIRDRFHLDVMDGVFVPNISFGIPIIKSIKKVANKPLDVHLMITDPDRYITKFKEVGADILTVHYEACNHLDRTIFTIKSQNMKAGVAINPHTSIDLLEDVLGEVDLICIMSVNPGFGGQSFIPTVEAKIRRLKEAIDAQVAAGGRPVQIQVDGGVKAHNIAMLREWGVSNCVVGSGLFNDKASIADNLAVIHQALE